MSSSRFFSEINTDSNVIEVLDELAEQVRAAHQAVQLTESNALDSALAAGTALLAIQGRVGSMKDWMAKNLREIGSSTLKLYIQLARGRDKIEAARKDNPFLSIRDARQLLTKRKPSEPEPEPDEEPDSETLLPEVSDAQLVALLTAKGLDWLLENMPSEWRSQIQARLRGHILRSEQAKHPNVRMRHLRIVHPESSIQH